MENNTVKVVLEKQRGNLATFLRETKDISFFMRMRIAYEIAGACKW